MQKSKLPKFPEEHSVRTVQPLCFILKCRVRDASHKVLSHFENLLQNLFISSYSSSTKDSSHWIIPKLISLEKYKVYAHTKRFAFCHKHANIFL